MIIDKLFTWVDVQDILEDYFSQEKNEEWLNNISFQSYWDGLTINYANVPDDIFPKNPGNIYNKLEEIFLARIQKKGEDVSIILDGNSNFPVTFEEVEKDDISYSRIKPALSRQPYISKKEKIGKSDRNSIKKPYFFAFHSFKGGVGRTLHSIAFAIQLAEKHKVLLIDADFEAPGITWLFNNPQISFADVLALIHGNKDIGKIINQISESLKSDKFENNNLFILPAFRGLTTGSLPILEIKPEHVFKFSPNPFILTDFLEQLAIKLQVDYIIIDLRAGVSELSTGWFLDPRINKVFVTTLSSQSILGTSMMFNVLSKFEKENQINDTNPPFLIISQVPKDTLKAMESNWSGTYVEGVLGELRNQFGKSFINLDDYSKNPDYTSFTPEEILGREMEPLTLFSVENDNLKSLPDTWAEVSKLIKLNNLPKQTLKLSSFLPAIESTQSTIKDDFSKSRELLKKMAHDLVFAEQTNDGGFLVTESIEKFIDNFKAQVPVAVIVGAKGSGKTFLFKQICNAKKWGKFCEIALSPIQQANDAHILPVIIPQNMSMDSFVTIGDEIKQITNAKITRNIWIEYIKKDIESSLKNDLTITQWREKWINYIAWAAGLNVNEEDAGKNFLELLKTTNKKIVAVVDGLEDLFKQFDSEQHQQNALSALLQDVPNWLDSQPEKFLGVIVFVRKDIVTAAIPQNSGQFFSKYSNYELKWNADEALRLVHWIINKYQILGYLTFEGWERNLKEKTKNELIESLYKLWGMRMAKNGSKEAQTHLWVLGSLANLKKEVQSRDIIRFLEFAANNSITPDSKLNELYKDRILYPSAIREAINEVGKEKIDEVKKENLPLKKVLELLEQKEPKMKFPCKPGDIDRSLDKSQIKILEDNGVLILYDGEYYMAEIYRKGMGFEYSRRGRPKLLYF